MTDMKSINASFSAAVMSRRGLLVGAGGFTAAGVLRSAKAAPRIEITEGNVQPLPIAIPDFVGGGASDGELARGVSQVIAGDLKRSGLFAPIDPAAFIEKILSSDTVPRFPDWRAINAQGLVTGRVTRL